MQLARVQCKQCAVCVFHLCFLVPRRYYKLAHTVSEVIVRQPAMLKAGQLREYQLVRITHCVMGGLFVPDTYALGRSGAGVRPCQAYTHCVSPARCDQAIETTKDAQEDGCKCESLK